jgi:hypothetical protein
MKIERVALGMCFFLALGRTASADAGLSNFGHLAGEPRATEEKRAAAPRKRKTVPAAIQRRDRPIDPWAANSDEVRVLGKPGSRPLAFLQ